MTPSLFVEHHLLESDGMDIDINEEFFSRSDNRLPTITYAQSPFSLFLNHYLNPYRVLVDLDPSTFMFQDNILNDLDGTAATNDTLSQGEIPLGSPANLGRTLSTRTIGNSDVSDIMYTQNQVSGPSNVSSSCGNGIINHQIGHLGTLRKIVNRPTTSDNRIPPLTGTNLIPLGNPSRVFKPISSTTERNGNVSYDSSASSASLTRNPPSNRLLYDLPRKPCKSPNASFQGHLSQQPVSHCIPHADSSLSSMASSSSSRQWRDLTPYVPNRTGYQSSLPNASPQQDSRNQVPWNPLSLMPYQYVDCYGNSAMNPPVPVHQTHTPRFNFNRPYYPARLSYRDRHREIKISLTREEVLANERKAQTMAAAKRGMTLQSYLIMKEAGNVPIVPPIPGKPQGEAQRAERLSQQS
ncbi:uncharacterized protein IL334_004049 [Kwoniella shivajii]|uniref:Uncharacterized protein n=1 Tax=Kwoniella shivajii TaxID=564305 RepID=A0ABZ1CZC5_9TREE|nr:hypothetical protein IL334_004049 [Kwoniella shivajii]